MFFPCLTFEGVWRRSAVVWSPNSLRGAVHPHVCYPGHHQQQRPWNWLQPGSRYSRQRCHGCNPEHVENRLTPGSGVKKSKFKQKGFSSSGLRQNQAVCIRDQEKSVYSGDHGGILWLSGNHSWHSNWSWCSLHLRGPLQHPWSDCTTQRTTFFSIIIAAFVLFLMTCLFDRQTWSI